VSGGIVGRLPGRQGLHAGAAGTSAAVDIDALTLEPAVAQAEAVRRGRVTSRDLVEAHLDRIGRHNGTLNAVVTLDADGARRRADERDAELARGRLRGPFHGVPMTVKDAFATAGIRTTSGMRERRDHVPDGDAVVVARLVTAGVVILGKTNVPEGITGQETANALFGRTVNPWDPDRTPGGSSGGAAAAVAAGLSALEIGSDSGGSIRQPAHCCGIYGHVPTQGLVPLRGHLPLVPLEEERLQIDLMGAGPLARHPADLAAALDVIAGPDGADRSGWTLSLPPPRRHGLAGARIGLWVDDPDFPVEAAVRNRFEHAAERLAAAGALVDPAPRPGFTLAEAARVAFALWAASTTASTDHFAALAEAADALDPGDDRLPARRLRAEALRHHDWTALDGERRRLARAWTALLDRYDVVLCPVSPVVAVFHDPEPALVADIERRLARTIDIDARPRPYLDQLTWNIVVGMAGLPSTVVPLGPSVGGLPVGAQVVGPPYADRTTIAFAAAMGDVIGGYRPPPLIGGS
jgi:amidase